ncbi:hypothetical protein GCM10007304_17740 [Rhodococcoides trifolii]|uniref:Major capsid protein n=1 Tax=Rhodococcoides trifolii TaxID=908250 RepID=A0A917FSE0_9NOCA|nr:major capsid protein [Rhodococcus trifolii]GGG04042.1 hypothetical protein GCM10007304_17740 [Rhodococcus trifolii]
MDPITLQDLVNKAQEADGGKAVEALTAFLKDNPTLDVSALTKEAVAQFNEILDGASESDDATLAAELLVEVIDGLRAEQTRRDEVVTDRASRLEALKAKVNADPAPADDAPVDDAPADTATDAPADAAGAEGDAAPAATVTDITPAATEPAAPAADAPTGDALAASGRPAPRRRVDIASLPRRQAPVSTHDDNRMTIVAAAEVPGVPMGTKLDGISELSLAAVSRFGALPLGPMAGGDVPPEGSTGTKIKAGIASIRNIFPADMTQSPNAGDDDQLLDRISNERRLEGESLVASGGWCSPSETLYELAGELEATTNLIDLPEIAVTRGGIRTTEGPDFSAIYSGAGIGVYKTEAEAIAGYTKAVYRVPCTNWTDTRAGVVHTAIEAGILQNDAYPEMTQRVTRGALVAHAHKVNALSIAQVEAQSTSGGTVTMGPSATTAILNGLNFQMTHYRYLYRAADTMSLEVKLPLFAKELFKADLAVASGMDRTQALNITDEQINAWFTVRHAKVQWLYDWQDAFTGATGATALGSATLPTAWPTSIKAIIYAAGAFVRGRGEIVSLNAVYDSTNIKVNDFLHLFVEEKLLVLRRQYKAYVTTFPVDLSGTTSAPQKLDATGKIVAA